MKQTNWYKDAIVYQIYPRSFKDSNGDGIGDIRGIIEKLDYLKDLGINCVWLSPIYQSPMDDNGYDISDYYSIHPMFGTMDDFKEMLDGMHKRGIRLIMDLVMNHTSDEHPWFKAACNNDEHYRNFYIWKKGKKRNKAPNNWTGFFGEGAWEYHEPSGEYYLHLFGKKQPDLNWENPNVRNEMKEIIRFWCDMGVDGFRLDVINVISKNQKFANGREFLFLKGSKSFINGPRLHEYLQEINRDAFSNYDLMTVGETVFTKLDDMKLLTDESRQELSMVFNFDHTSVDNYFGVKWFMRKFSLARFKKILGKYQKGLKDVGWNSIFYENHDQRRSVGRFNTNDDIYRERSAKMLATSLYFLKGTPFIYQGQEIGMTNTDIDKLEDYQDIETHNIYKTAKAMKIPNWYIEKTIPNGTRDNARTPMQWSDDENAGFTTGKPWLKVNANYEYLNVDFCKKDKDSILNYYKKLLSIRKKEKLVKEGNYIDLLPKHKDIYAYYRTGEDAKLLVVANYSPKNVKVDLGFVPDNYDVLINNYPVLNLNSIEPYQAFVLKIKNKK